jgi:hypothetical protein
MIIIKKLGGGTRLLSQGLNQTAYKNKLNRRSTAAKYSNGYPI